MASAHLFKMLVLLLLGFLACALASPVGLDDSIQPIVDVNHPQFSTGALNCTTDALSSLATRVITSTSSGVALTSRPPLSVPPATTTSDTAQPTANAPSKNIKFVGRYCQQRNNRDYGAVHREAYSDHLDLAKVARKFKPYEKWEKAADMYFGTESSEKLCGDKLSEVHQRHIDLHSKTGPETRLALWCLESLNEGDDGPYGMKPICDEEGTYAYSFDTNSKKFPGFIVHNMVFCERFYDNLKTLKQLGDTPSFARDADTLWYSRGGTWYHELMHQSFLYVNETEDYADGPKECEDYANKVNCLSYFDHTKEPVTWNSTLLNADTWSTFALMVYFQEKWNMDDPPPIEDDDSSTSKHRPNRRLPKINIDDHPDSPYNPGNWDSLESL